MSNMDDKATNYKELSLNSRKALFGILWESCKDGKVEHGKK
jgi:hypothetical protein